MLVAGFVLSPVGPRANETVEQLLSGLAENQVRPKVDVLSWIEGNPGQQKLVISFAPSFGTRLVADPGIRVEPAPGQGVEWADKFVLVKDNDREYFDTPPRIEVGIRSLNAPSVKAHVEYAYCLVDQICLFGEHDITASAPKIN